MGGLRSTANVIRGVLIVALVALGGVISLTPRAADAASAKISLSKNMVPAGNYVTVKGNSFHSGDKVTVTLVDVGTGPSSAHQLTSMNANVNGSGAFGGSLTVPKGTNSGFYAVTAVDTHGNIASQILGVPVELQVKGGQAGAHINPVPGLMVSIAGTGFAPKEKVQLSARFPMYNGNALTVTKTATASATGAFDTVSFRVPWQAKDGNVPLTVTGANSGKKYAVTVPMHVSHKPFVIVASGNITAAQSLVVEAVGFAPNERITAATVISRTAAGTSKLVKVVKAGNPFVTRIGIYLPRNVKAGTYVISVFGATTKAHAAMRYTVSASAASTSTPGPKATSTAGPKPTATSVPAHTAITVAPRSVIPGASAQVLGEGFPANTQVTISSSVGRTNAAPQAVQVSVKTNGKGEFTATLHIPGNAAAGGYSVTAKAGSRSASGTLHIAYLKTSVVSVPARAIPGTPITVTGFGYSSGSTVTISLNGQKLGTVTANASGTFKTQLTVPGSLSTGWHPLVAQDNSGRKASFSLQVYRHIATHFYFASLFTGGGFHESLLFTNASATKAVVHITYQRQNGAPSQKTIAVGAHSRLTHDVNADLGGGTTGAASISADVPISAERLVMHGRDGSLDPGASSPSQRWYFANGNTSHQYREQIAVQNPSNASAQVTIQVEPTHSKTYWLHGTMRPQSRMSWNLNKTSHDAIGVIVSANRPVVANRTIFIHNGITSKTGVEKPQNHWYFAAGPTGGNTRHWIGVTNTTNQSSYMVLQAYNAEGAQVATVKKWLRPYDRQGFLMNKYAGQTEVAVVVSTTKPSIAEQSTFVTGNHDAHTDTFGVTSPQKMAEFADATTWPHQDNLLALFNPNAAAIPVVVQFLNTHGGTSQQTYVVAPFAHAYIDVGKIVKNSQLGLLAVSNYPFVALDIQRANDGGGAMITLGTQS